MHILFIIYNKRVRHHLASVVAYARVEAVVHRSLHYYLVARQRKCLYYSRYCRHHTRSVYNVALIDGPSVVLAKPLAHRLVVAVWHTCVSKDAMCHTTLQRLGYAGVGLEVHVGHPEGYYIV